MTEINHKAVAKAIDDTIRERDEARAERDRLRTEWTEFTSAIGFGDDKTEPAPTAAELVDPINDAFHAARNHDECPVVCEGCGETLASKTCPRCHGSGCLPNPQLAYAECDECAGAGKIHEACTGQDSYADLVAERDELRAKVAHAAAIVSGDARWEGAEELGRLRATVQRVEKLGRDLIAAAARQRQWTGMDRYNLGVADAKEAIGEAILKELAGDDGGDHDV